MKLFYPSDGAELRNQKGGTLWRYVPAETLIVLI